MKLKQPVCLFLVLLGVAFLVRILYGKGLIFADDFAYINIALDANEIGWFTYLSSMSNPYESRISIILPVAFFTKIFGASERTFLSLSLLFSLGTILCTFLLGTILHNSRTGFIAALIVTFIPQDIWYSTATLPDTFIPLYTGLSLLCLAAGLKYQQTGFRELLLYICSGVFIFYAFEVRESSVIVLLPLIIAVIWSKRRNLKAIVVPTATFCFALAFFWFILFLLSGDFFRQYKIIVNFAGSPDLAGSGKPFEHLLSMAPLLKFLLKVPQLLSHGNLLTLTNVKNYLLNPNFGLLFYLAWPALAYSLYHAHKYERYRLPVVSFIVLYLFFEFASTSLTSYQCIWKEDRFLTILSIPSALLIAFFIERILHLKPVFKYRVYLKKAAIFLILTYLLVSIALLVVDDLWHFSHVPTYKRTFERLKTLNLSHRIYVMHKRWILRGKVMMRLHPSQDYTFSLLKNVPVDSIHHAVVIFDPTYFTDVADTIGGRKMRWEEFDPAFKDIPNRLPEGWKLLFAEPRHMGRGRRPAEVYVLYAL